MNWVVGWVVYILQWMAGNNTVVNLLSIMDSSKKTIGRLDCISGTTAEDWISIGSTLGSCIYLPLNDYIGRISVLNYRVRVTLPDYGVYHVPRENQRP